MVRSVSLFSQLLAHVPKLEFAGLIQQFGAEKGAKGFTCWSQLVSMLFCHFAKADSLREICTGLSCCLGKLQHLGLKDGPKRSTLSYANAHRPAEVFEALLGSMLDRFRNQGRLGPGRKTKFRFKNKLMSLDSSTITLCLAVFPWATFRRSKGGVKLHVLLDHDDYMPSFAVLSNARQADVRQARLRREAGIDGPAPGSLPEHALRRVV